MNLPSTVRRYGSTHPLPERIPLRAGPLSLIYEAGCLRYVRIGGEEAMRRIYVAIRDQRWGTAPDQLSNVEMDIQPDSFAIRYDNVNRLGDIEFAWRGEIRGDADGTIRFSMDGVAQSDFLRARIGFCVLPPMSIAGHSARIWHVDGSEDAATFPEAIAPQLVVEGLIKPVAPFDEMRALAYTLASGESMQVEFEGDIFEMEDQRNWTDASYKIYSTPLRLPWPVQVHKGERIRQSVTLKLTGSTPTVTNSQELIPTITIDADTRHPLPAIGLGQASHGNPLTAMEANRMRTLGLSHIRVDLDLASASWAQRFSQACDDAATIDAALEVALFVDDATDQWPILLELISERRPEIARWIVFDAAGLPANQQLLEHVKTLVKPYQPDAEIGSGVNGFFTELNKLRPDAGEFDFVAYSLNPQVHAYDNSSVMETPEAQAVTVLNAKSIYAQSPIVVSPVTLRMRPPVAAPPDTNSADLAALPPYVDVRQMSLFGAAWTVASLKHLAGSGAQSVTYYETTGWRGVMEREAGSPAPQLFPSVPGGVYPMYHVFADVAEFAKGTVLETQSTRPLEVEALALNDDASLRMLVAE